MLDILAQTYSTYDTTTLSGGEKTGLAAFFGAYFLFAVVLWLVQVVALWRIFDKMGIEGWKSIIPIYNYWVLCEAVGKPGWWALSFLLAVIPVINIIGWIVPLVLGVIVMLEVGKGFGKDAVWSVFLLIIFSLVGLLILGFGDATFDKKRLSAPKTAA
jgi:hypothetical protein